MYPNSQFLADLLHLQKRSIGKFNTLGVVFHNLYMRTEYSNTFAKETELITLTVKNFNFLKQTWFLHSSLRT